MSREKQPSTFGTLRKWADRYSTIASLAILVLLFVIEPRVSGIVSATVWGVVLLLLILPIVNLTGKFGGRR